MSKNNLLFSVTQNFRIDQDDAEDILYTLGNESFAKKYANDFFNLLIYIKGKYESHKNIDINSQLPVLGDVQPTHGEMAEAIKPLAKAATELSEFLKELPMALLKDVKVPLLGFENPKGLEIEVIINALSKTLTEHYEKHKAETKPGKPNTEQKSAAFAASHLLSFIKSFAPDTDQPNIHTFLHISLSLIEIPHPDPDSRSRDFLSFLEKAQSYKK